MPARKTTKISLLFSESSRQSPWASLNETDLVDQSLKHARKEFGPSGTQSGRRWFYRFREEIFWSTIGQTKTGWRSVPRMRYWCDIYFRNPQDATWFHLKQQ